MRSWAPVDDTPLDSSPPEDMNKSVKAAVEFAATVLRLSFEETVELLREEMYRDSPPYASVCACGIEPRKEECVICGRPPNIVTKEADVREE